MATKDNFFSRQLDIINPELLDFEVTVVGAGGIGSWTALVLAKTGIPRLNIVDGDLIEDVNVAPQFYTPKHIGMNKAVAVSERINEEIGNNVATPIPLMWDEEVKEQVSGQEILVMAVDNMDVRRQIWEDIKLDGLNLVVEGRMQREQFEINAINPDNEEHIKHFEKRLFPSSAIKEEIACTERAVAYNQFVISGLIALVIKQYAQGKLTTKFISCDLANYLIMRS